MHSDAPDVDTYLADLPDARREALGRLRTTCLELLVGFEEQMAFGMPGYARDGAVEVSFASQRRYVSLYILRADVLARHRDALPASTGKGCVRYGSPARIDWDVVRAVLGDVASTRGATC